MLNYRMNRFSLIKPSVNLDSKKIELFKVICLRKLPSRQRCP
jgi:hypothetical protein